MPTGEQSQSVADEFAVRAHIAQLDGVAWRVRYLDPSDLELAVAALASAARPDGNEAGLVEFHRAWHSLSVNDNAGAAVRHARARALFERGGHWIGIEHLRTVEALLLRREGNAPEGLAILNAASDVGTDRIRVEAQCIASIVRAICHSDIGNLDDCLRDYLSALAFARRSNLPAYEANVLGNLGGFHADVLNFDESERMCRRAFMLADEVGARSPWATSGINWMLALFGLSRYAEAKDVALQLLARQAWLPSVKRASYFTKFAAVFLHAGEAPRAEQFLDQVQAESGVAATSRTMEWFWVRAELCNAQSHYAEAARLCAQALAAEPDFTEAALPTDLLRLYNAATAASEALGDYQSALRYKKAAFAKYEALVGLGARAKRLTLQVEYEIQHAQWQRDEALQEQRIAEEEQVRLATLYRALEAANAAKSRFLAAASHDLRQPVHAVGLFADTLVDLCPAGEERDMVARIQQSMLAMNGMLSELQDISTLNAGATRASVQALPITSVLLHIDSEFGPIARARALDLRLAAPDAWVRSDPVLLKRILQNLVANALAYTERGGVLVTARARADALLLEVWDTGIGIEAAHLPRIFDEFYQIGNVARDRRQGMGLGLAIVRRLVDLLGHRLEVHSRPGRGTRFRLTLPLAAAVEQTAPDQTVALTDLAGNIALVVDDEPDARDSMAAALAARGCGVIVASSAAEAIAKLQLAPSYLDFAVMDYRLETQTGLEALTAIRAHVGRHLPALIVTGDTLATDLARFAAAGEAWLIKPVSADDLCRAVMRLLPPAAAGVNA